MSEDKIGAQSFENVEFGLGKRLVYRRLPRKIGRL